MTHDELRELSGGYALGVLDEPDREAFEAHLATCAACTAEVRDLTEVAATLALDLPQIDPPPALRERVLRAAIGAAPTSPAASGVSGQAAGGAGLPPDQPPLKLRRSAEASATAEGGIHAKDSPPRWRQPVLAMLSAAAVLVALALGIYAASLLRRIESLEQQLRVAADREALGQQQLVQLRAASDTAAQVRRILAAGDLRRADLAGTKAAPAVSGRAFWSPTQGMVVAFANLPPTEAGRVYQLWVIPPGGDPIGAGLLDLESDGRALALARPGTSDRVGTVAITLEPAGGSTVPTLSNMIAAGNVAN
jgi:anti-sigma-K factor RskA